MAKYKAAVEWIARNDEQYEMQPSVIAEMISVQLIADIWKKTPEAVALDVALFREEHEV